MTKVAKSIPSENIRRSVLDSELKNAEDSIRGRITRRIGRAVTGKDHPLQIVSGKEAELASIKEAGHYTVEGSLDEARNQLSKVKNSRMNKLAKTGMKAFGKKDYVPKKERTLTAIESELQAELAPRPEELDQAYALNKLQDISKEVIGINSEQTDARRRDTLLNDPRYDWVGRKQGVKNDDPEILELQRSQSSAHIDALEKRKRDLDGRGAETQRTLHDAEQADFRNNHSNPRPARLRNVA